MTVSSETNRWDYTGNGALQTYPFTAEIYAKTDLLVYVSGALKTVDVDYTIDAASIENPAGGNVVFTTAPLLSAPIAIVLNLPMTQLIDYVEGDKFPAETHERALDRLVKLIQYLKGKFSHVAKLGDDSPIELVMPNPVADNFIGWNAAATNLENKANPVVLTTATQWEVDALVTYGGGTAYTKATIDTALTAIGMVNKTTLLLRPGNWTITASADYSSYTNVTFKMPNGSYFTITALMTLTLPSPSNIIASPNQQIFSGAGTVKFSIPGRVYPQWWYSGTGTWTTSIQEAIDSIDLGIFLGGTVYLQDGEYEIDGTLTGADFVTVELSQSATIVPTTDENVFNMVGRRFTVKGGSIDVSGIAWTSAIFYATEVNGSMGYYGFQVYDILLKQNMGSAGDHTGRAFYVNFDGTPAGGDSLYYCNIHGVYIYGFEYAFYLKSAYSGAVVHATNGFQVTNIFIYGSVNFFYISGIDGNLFSNIMAQWNAYSLTYITLINSNNNVFSPTMLWDLLTGVTVSCDATSKYNIIDFNGAVDAISDFGEKNIIRASNNRYADAAFTIPNASIDNPSYSGAQDDFLAFANLNTTDYTITEVPAGTNFGYAFDLSPETAATWLAGENPVIEITLTTPIYMNTIGVASKLTNTNGDGVKIEAKIGGAYVTKYNYTYATADGTEVPTYKIARFTAALVSDIKITFTNTNALTVYKIWAYGRRAGSSYLPRNGGTLYGDLNLNTGKVLKVAGTQVVGAQQTGVSAMTNVSAPSNLDANTVNVAELADIVGTLIVKLRAHGLVAN